MEVLKFLLIIVIGSICTLGLLVLILIIKDIVKDIIQLIKEVTD